MVRSLTIGVLGIQGDVSEHINSMTNALKETEINGKVFVAKRKEEIQKLDALIIPGGESSTISKVLQKTGIHIEIFNRIKKNNLYIMGTCAGCVLLAKEIVNKPKDIKTLNAMDIKVERNAFGRQKESFEQKLSINGFSDQYPAVFIRAPVIKKIWNKCEILAKIDKKIVMARQEKYLALSFHPELTSNLRVHEYFLNMII